MASINGSIVDLQDENHPNLELTKANNASPFFKLLPREIRLMIYEFAVYVDHPIKPRQSGSHSNKFIHGSSSEEKEEKFTTVCLANTCRGIYADLDEWNPFYKVNKFKFSTPKYCFVFLAGITPKRRKEIHSITIELHDHLFMYFESKFDQNFFALLSQCDSLHSHALDVIFIRHRDSFYSVEDYITAVTEEIEKCTTRIKKLLRGPIKKTHDRDPLWELPFFYCSFVDEPRFTVPDLERLNHELHNEQRVYRKKIGYENPPWFKEMAKNTRLHEAAVLASGIHFPGELRVTLDKANTSIGPVATRTRSKCKAPNPEGVLERTIPRYNEQGTLTWPPHIDDFRWDGTDVQCLVRDRKGSTWEDLYAVLELENEYWIRLGYTVIMAQYKTKRDEPGSRDKFASIPHPKYIFEIAKATLPLSGARNCRNMLSWKRWPGLIKRWDLLLKYGTEDGPSRKK